MPLSPTQLFVCSACGAVLPVGPELLGKKCRCGRCGKVSVVTEDGEPERAEQPAASSASVHFYCRVCDTHLAAREQDVGRKARCPDCGALTEVPPLPETQPKKSPRAIHGQQYGVWGVDDAPSGSELAAKQPKYFPVYCRVCDTLMHAQLKQVGKKLACPDCGAKTVIEEPLQPEPKKSPLVPDGLEYQLDAAHIPPTRPEPQFEPPEPTPDSVKSEEIREERKSRPRMPRMPTLQGVASMLLKSPMLGWWLWLSVGALMIALLMGVVLGEANGPIQLLFQLACYGMVFSLGGLWLSAASALWLRVMTESSEGNDRLHHPPGANFLDWFGDMLYLITSSTLALAPWWLLCRVLEKDLTIEQQGLLQVSGWLLTFPLLLLSCLENGSPLELVSPKVFGSVAKLPGHWLLLIVQSVAIVGVCFFATAGLLVIDPRLALLAVPLCVAASLLYYRILGRFAWWLAESLATAEEK